MLFYFKQLAHIKNKTNIECGITWKSHTCIFTNKRNDFSKESKKLYFLPPKITKKGAVPARYVTICYIPLPFTARYVTICYKMKPEWRRYVTKKIGH